MQLGYRQLNYRKNSGLTLVELLVAMVLGLVLSGAAIQTFVAVKDSNRILNINSQMQENGRFGLWFLGNALQMAGFREDLSDTWEQAFPASGSFGLGEVIRGTEGGSDADSFEVRYEGYTDTFNQDCVGSNIASGSEITISYSIDDSGNLLCSVNGAAATAMVEGVDTLQVLYGVDLTGDGEVNAYLDADSVTNWANVYSVRLGALIASTGSTASVNNTRTYSVLGDSFSVDDDRVRQVFTMTIGLKNLVQ